MTKLRLLTAILATITAFVHLFVGTYEIHQPLLQSQLPEEIRLLLYACWHLVSATLIFSSVIFFKASRAQTIWLISALNISWMWLCFGLIFIAISISLGSQGMLFKLPQWILLLPIGLMGIKAFSKKGIGA